MNDDPQRKTVLNRRLRQCHRRLHKSCNPRVDIKTSIAEHTDERRATDFTCIWTKYDGLVYVNEVIDCGDRGVVGYVISKNCGAQEAVWALEDACIRRFDILPRGDGNVVVRSDNGLVFASQMYRQQLTEYGLTQEFIHPHTPGQNGVIEAYHKTFKRECAWQRRFKKLDEVVRVVSAWIERYNTRRPHSNLGYLMPQAWRERDLARITSLSIQKRRGHSNCAFAARHHCQSTKAEATPLRRKLLKAVTQSCIVLARFSRPQWGSNSASHRRVVPRKQGDRHSRWKGLPICGEVGLVEQKGAVDKYPLSMQRETFACLYRIETFLRELIIDQLEGTGARWRSQRIPPDIRESIRKGIEYERGFPLQRLRLLDPVYYAYLSDLKKIITQKNNWEDCFRKQFTRKESLEQKLQEIEAVRNAIAHNRSVSAPERDLVLGFERYLCACVSEARYVELCARETRAPSLTGAFQALLAFLHGTGAQIAECASVSEPEVLTSLSHRGLLDELFLGADPAPLKRLLVVLKTYRAMPRSRGSGHKIQSFASSERLADLNTECIRLIEGALKHANG